jgi:hypothetical protein
MAGSLVRGCHLADAPTHRASGNLKERKPVELKTTS